MYIIGIDPGINGGLCVLKHDKIIEKIVMPLVGKEYDAQSIFKFLKKYKNSKVILEKSQPQFRDGRKQAFKTGYGYGLLQGIITTLEIPYEIVMPKMWQKRVFEGLPHNDTKVASIMFCKRKYPLEDWTPTERSQKIHDGLTDAACIACYGGLS